MKVTFRRVVLWCGRPRFHFLCQTCK